MRSWMVVVVGCYPVSFFYDNGKVMLSSEATWVLKEYPEFSVYVIFSDFEDEILLRGK